MDIIVSVVTVPGSGYVYSAPAVYELKARKDGTKTYRRAVLPLGTMLNKNGRRLPVGFRSVKKAEEEARKVAERIGVPFVRGIRHGSLAQ
jgi:hypothetical protein